MFEKHHYYTAIKYYESRFLLSNLDQTKIVYINLKQKLYESIYIMYILCILYMVCSVYVQTKHFELFTESGIMNV